MTRMETAEHPEDLLDLAHAGRIGEAEWQELRRHLALCLPCATQLRMSSRGFAEAEGKDKPSDVYFDRVAVQRTLERTKGSRSSVRSSFGARWVPIGVGMLLVSSGALAGTWWSVRHRAEMSPITSSSRPAAAVTGTRAKRHVSIVEGASPLPSVASPPPLPVVTELGAPPIGARGRADRASAGELFARARALRLGGDATGALSVYRRLQHQYSDSRESALSYLVVGRMWLDRDRPDLAARQFSHYLDMGGSAAEEALVGRATAYGRMGRPADEVADWKQLVSEHPGSVYASRANARMGELGGPSGGNNETSGFGPGLR